MRRAARTRSSKMSLRRRTRPARRPHPDEIAIERRIAGGEAAEAFLCVECWCWMLEPAYCLCRERALW
jgi:hypothetical protein